MSVTTHAPVAGSRRRPSAIRPAPVRPSSSRPADSPVRSRAVRSGRVTACAGVHGRQASVVRVSWATRLKVGAVACLALLGAGVSVAEFASWEVPAETTSASDPGWAHVAGR